MADLHCPIPAPTPVPMHSLEEIPWEQKLEIMGAESILESDNESES